MSTLTTPTFWAPSVQRRPVRPARAVRRHLGRLRPATVTKDSDSKLLEIGMIVMGHSFICKIVRSHRSLVGCSSLLPSLALFAALTRSFAALATSFAHSLQSSWESGLFESEIQGVLNHCHEGLLILTGGVVIFSKYPIVETHELLFKDSAVGTIDNLSNKGALMAKVMVPDDRQGDRKGGEDTVGRNGVKSAHFLIDMINV